MQLREQYKGINKYSLLIVEKPKIANFKLFGEDILEIDCRSKFIDDLHKYLDNRQLNIFDGSSSL